MRARLIHLIALLFGLMVGATLLRFSDPIGPLLARPLEACFSAIEPTRPIDGIIVLGGDLERVVEAVKLARRFPEARIVLTGAGEEDRHELLRSHRFLAGRIVIEPSSRTTFENAIFSAKLLEPKPAQKWILVTSAPHMPRAVGVFRKAGFDVYPWPAVYQSERYRLSLAVGLHEWVGLAVYWLMGRSDSLFPCARQARGG